MKPTEDVPGSAGTIGPSRGQFNLPHVYARDVLSGAGNCVCGWPLGDDRHTEAAPGIPIPREMRYKQRPVDRGTIARPGSGPTHPDAM